MTLLEQMINEQIQLMEEKKRKKGKAKYVMAVNGNVVPMKITKKELKAEVQRLIPTGAKVEVFKLVGDAKTNLDIEIPGEEA